MTSDAELPPELERLEPVSLEALEERAALLRRVDHKYAVDRDRLRRLLDRLGQDHTVLEIDGGRAFDYETTYFETPDLRCFTDHVEDRRPRFKARTRYYRRTQACVFEVKLKGEDGETDKRQIDYRPEHREELTDEARTCLEEALRDAGADPVEQIEPGLHTRFRRVTLVSARGSERLTCDFAVRLVAASGAVAQMRNGLALVETKSEDGQSPADEALAGLGLEPISLSKYRVGIGLVGPDRVRGPQPGSDLFEVERD